MKNESRVSLMKTNLILEEVPFVVSHYYYAGQQTTTF